MRNPLVARPECVALGHDVDSAWSVEGLGQFGQRSVADPFIEALQLFCIASWSRATLLANSSLIALRSRYRPIDIDFVRRCSDGSLAPVRRRFHLGPWYCSPMACGSSSTQCGGCCTWPGIEKIARHHHWVLQLCHFHLLLKLQAPRRRVRYTLRGGAVREEIYQSIRNALLLPDGKRFAQTVEHLERLSWGDCGTLRIKTVLGQFLLDLPFYRSYLAHPELGLPLTTNAVESMCRLLREMLRSSRAGSNPKSLLLWVTALIRMRSTVTCNGHTINRIS
jgi:hypothetical protein